MLREYYDLIADIPPPSEQQITHFASHLVVAHSWYKHLALSGAEFVVFLDPDAGGGFTEEQPRIHHTWATRQDYVARFGHLAYMYRHSPLEPFATDYALNARVDVVDQRVELVDRRETAVLDLPREVRADCGFTLYPFACDNDVFFRRFEPELSLLAQGQGDHACRELLVAYYRAETAYQDAFVEISEESKRRYELGVPCRGALRDDQDGYRQNEWQYIHAEMRYIAEAARISIDRSQLSSLELTFLQLEYASAAAWRRLEEQELAKVRNALARLSEHLEAASRQA